MAVNAKVLAVNAKLLAVNAEVLAVNAKLLAVNAQVLAFTAKLFSSSCAKICPTSGISCLWEEYRHGFREAVRMSDENVNLSKHGNLALVRAIRYLAYPPVPGGECPIATSSGLQLMTYLASVVDVNDAYKCSVLQDTLAEATLLSTRTIRLRLAEFRRSCLITLEHQFAGADHIALDAEGIFEHRELVQSWRKPRTSSRGKSGVGIFREGE